MKKNWHVWLQNKKSEMQRGVGVFAKPPGVQQQQSPGGFRFQNTSPIASTANKTRVRIDVSRLQQQKQQESSSSSDEEASPPHQMTPSVSIPVVQQQHQQLLEPVQQTPTPGFAGASMGPFVIPHNVVRITFGILMIWALGITLVVIIHMRSSGSNAPSGASATFSTSFMIEQNGQTYSFVVDLADRPVQYHLCCTDTEGATRCGIDVRHISVHVVDKKATVNVNFPPRVYLSKCTLFCARGSLRG